MAKKITKDTKELKKITCEYKDHKGKRLISEANFYKSKSPMFSDGRVHVCKKCLKNMIDYNDMETIYRAFQILDIPFFYNRWKECESRSGNRDIFGNYVRMANSEINEFKGARYSDSVFEPKESAIDMLKNNETIKNKKNKYEIEGMTKEQLIDKFGIGYTDEEYYCFEKKWRKLEGNYGQKTALHTEALANYVRFRVKEELATANGDVAEATKWGALAEKAQSSGKLSVSQLSKSDISGGVDLLPQLFEAVENEVGIISILPKLKEQPYDDADLIIWSIEEYLQRLEDRPRIKYKDIWNFYDEMLIGFYKQKGFSDSQIEEERKKRNAIFRDLSEVYKEPLYDEGDA